MNFMHGPQYLSVLTQNEMDIFGRFEGNRQVHPGRC